MIQTKTLRRTVSVFAVVGSLAFVQAASAAQINATMGIGTVGNIMFTDQPGFTDLGHAASVTLPPIEFVSSLPATFNGNPNDFIGPVNIGDAVTVNPLALSLHPAMGFTPNFVTFDGFSFTLTSMTSSSSGAGNVELDGIGTLMGGGFAPTVAEFSAAFTQTLIGGAIGGTLTLSAPPLPKVPEAASLLVGFAPLGLLVGRFFKRKESRAARVEGIVPAPCRRHFVHIRPWALPGDGFFFDRTVITPAGRWRREPQAARRHASLSAGSLALASAIGTGWRLSR